MPVGEQIGSPRPTGVPRFQAGVRALLPRSRTALTTGSGESGKSTIVKQMKIIHQNGYTREELLAFKPTIHSNVLVSAQALVMAMRKIGVDPEDPTNRTYADRILGYKIDESGLVTAELFQAIEALWHDPIIPVIMDRSSEFYLMDSATYFFSNLDRISSGEYVPNENDVLRARSKTTGISETRFNMGQLSIHMFDVGGQRSERKKWIHCECFPTAGLWDHRRACPQAREASRANGLPRAC